MLLVKTVVKPSRIHGLGLFANQNIKKGEVIWIYNPLIDRRFDEKQLSRLPQHAKKFVIFYSYLNHKNQYVFPGDDARYVNHSDSPNISDVRFVGGKNSSGEEIGIAARNLK